MNVKTQSTNLESSVPILQPTNQQSSSSLGSSSSAPITESDGKTADKTCATGRKQQHGNLDDEVNNNCNCNLVLWFKELFAKKKIPRCP